MIDSFDQAIEVFGKILNEPFTLLDKENRNFGYAYFVMTESGKKYCMTYKRFYYKNFGYHFNNQEGWGQVANKDLISYCVLLGIDFVMVMPDSKIYIIDSKVFYDYYKEHKTDVPHLDGEIACPLRLFKNFKEVNKCMSL